VSGQPADFLNGKTEYTLGLFRFFIAQINDIGPPFKNLRQRRFKGRSEAFS